MTIRTSFAAGTLAFIFALGLAIAPSFPSAVSAEEVEPTHEEVLAAYENGEAVVVDFARSGETAVTVVSLDSVYCGIYGSAYCFFVVEDEAGVRIVDTYRGAEDSHIQLDGFVAPGQIVVRHVFGDAGFMAEWGELVNLTTGESRVLGRVAVGEGQPWEITVGDSGDALTVEATDLRTEQFGSVVRRSVYEMTVTYGEDSVTFEDALTHNAGEVFVGINYGATAIEPEGTLVLELLGDIVLYSPEAGLLR